MKRRATSGVGLFSVPVAPIHTRSGRDEVHQALAATVEDLRLTAVVNQLKGGNQVASDLPVAGSVAELVSAATGVSNHYLTAAQVADKRADQIAQQADQAVKQARAEGLSTADLLLKMQKESHDTTMALTKELHQTQLQAQNAKHEAAVQSISAKVDAALDQFNAQLAAKEKTIEQLKAEKEQALSRVTIEEAVMDDIKNNGANGWAAAYLNIPKADDPNVMYQRGMAQSLLDNHSAQLQSEVEERRAANARRAATDVMVQRFFDQAMQTVAAVRSVLPHVLLRNQAAAAAAATPSQGGTGGFGSPPPVATQDIPLGFDGPPQDVPAGDWRVSE